MNEKNKMNEKPDMTDWDNIDDKMLEIKEVKVFEEIYLVILIIIFIIIFIVILNIIKQAGGGTVDANKVTIRVV
jgi:hypothetical protein